MNPINIEQVRRDTPGCAEVIHFNNAGASLLPNPVFEALVGHLELERRMGGYEAKAFVQERLDHFYIAFARLLNCSPEEIAFVENATRAWDMAFYSIPFQEGDRILTARTEYASNYLAFLQLAKRSGIEIDIVENDESGQLDLDQLESRITPRVRLISVTHVPTQSGMINPVHEIGKIARKHDVLYLLDACQSVGQIPLDVQEIGCDILSGTGRKFLRGPRGTGFLYVRKSLIGQLEPPFIDLHAADWIDEKHYQLRPDARRFETWESNIAGRIALSVAVDYAMELNLSAIQVRVQGLAQSLREQLGKIKGVQVRDLGRTHSGIVTFTSAKETATDLQKRLLSRQINISVSTGNYARLDLGSRGISELARASVHYYNTEEEIDAFCHAVSD